MNWVTIVLGVALILAPFVTGYSGTPVALWTSLIMGAVIGVLGYARLFRWAALAGVLVFVAPWVLGFSGISAAFWSCLLLGAAVALLAGYQGFIAERDIPSGGAQHRGV